MDSLQVMGGMDPSIFPSFPSTPAQDPWSQLPSWPAPRPQSQSQSQTLIYCDGCGSTEHESADDGCYYCCMCGALIPDLRVTDIAAEDIFGMGNDAGIYSMRHQVLIESSQPTAAVLPSREEILRGLANAEMTEEQREREREKEQERERVYGFDEKVYEPRDFGGRKRPDPKSLVNGIRLRYVQGLQLMVQLQCEALVERHGVSPVICGIVGGIWMRYVTATRVLDDEWAYKVIEESEEVLQSQAGDDELAGKEPTRRKWEPHNMYGQRAIYIWLRSLKKLIPLHTSLALSFLACYVSRQPILPTDIVKWVLEVKLPYISAFVEIDMLLGRPSETCPLRSRTLFRPIHVIGAWALETSAGYIADVTGLHLPPVNFTAISRRYIQELSLPVEHVLSTACHIYEWSMPVELCLSKHPSKLPARVYVMAILITTIRILYNIQGQGVWETRLSKLGDCSHEKLEIDCSKQKKTSKVSVQTEDACQIQCEDICLGNCNDMLTNDKEMVHETLVRDSSSTQESASTTEELFRNLEAIYEKMQDTHDCLKDFKTYLKYCKDAISTGITKSCEEENLMERFWNMYKEETDDELRNSSGFDDQDQKRPREMDTALEDNADMHNADEKKHCLEKHMAGQVMDSSKKVHNTKDTTLRKLKSEMELNGFNYVPPKVQQTSGDVYIRYRRKRKWGKLFFVAHADYYILLRTCAKLVEVDCRILHLGVLYFESRLAWLERRVSNGLVSLRNGSLEALINLTQEDLKDLKS